MSLLGSRSSISEIDDWELLLYEDVLASGLELVDHVPTRAVYSSKRFEGEARHLTHASYNQNEYSHTVSVDYIMVYKPGIEDLHSILRQTPKAEHTAFLKKRMELIKSRAEVQ